MFLSNFFKALTKLLVWFSKTLKVSGALFIRLNEFKFGFFVGINNNWSENNVCAMVCVCVVCVTQAHTHTLKWQSPPLNAPLFYIDSNILSWMDFMFLFMPIAFLFGQRTLSAQFHTKNAIKCDAFITSILSHMNI